MPRKPSALTRKRSSKDGWLFASGQIPLDPKSGELVGGSIEQSAERIFDNLEAVLREAGLTLADVVKTTVFLTKTEDFPAMNAVYARRFGEHRPARSTVTVAGLPKGAPSRSTSSPGRARALTRAQAVAEAGP